VGRRSQLFLLSAQRNVRKAKGWLEEIKQAHPGKLAASDGASLDSAKKRPRRISMRNGTILNRAVIRGTGRIENTEVRQQAADSGMGWRES
jgi:hypothetical protein